MAWGAMLGSSRSLTSCGLQSSGVGEGDVRGECEGACDQRWVQHVQGALRGRGRRAGERLRVVGRGATVRHVAHSVDEVVPAEPDEVAREKDGANGTLSTKRKRSVVGETA